jgi:hypothetical protein
MLENRALRRMFGSKAKYTKAGEIILIKSSVICICRQTNQEDLYWPRHKNMYNSVGRLKGRE